VIVLFASAPSSQDPEHHHLVVIAAKDVFDLHIPKKPFLPCKYETQQSTIPRWLLYHLYQAVVISSFQEPLDCLCLAVLFLQQILG